ncbi:MAG: hypothetical protein QME96_10300 [Myxococcota bacterium]|nr:hypothetical protein [Myxococcota bacterium]
MNPLAEQSTEIAESLRALGSLDLPSLAGLGRRDLDALRALGLRKLRAGNPGAATDILDYLCFLEPHRPECWDAVAAARLAAGRIEQACEAVETAAALNPTWARAAVAARCRAMLGDADDAVARVQLAGKGGRAARRPRRPGAAHLA